MENINNNSRNGVERKCKIENPFGLKVGQVFSGFGIGCGLCIGVGRPLNLSAIPMLNQVMSATSGATHAFSGVSGHVNSSLRKLGAKNIQAGIGCGVGFGHGFGVGLAVKPGVIHQIQSSLTSPVMKDEDNLSNESGGHLRSETDILYMVLKHQVMIEDLLKENEKLHKILVEELKIPPNKLQTSYSRSTSPCSDCFECRRRQRRR